MSQRREELARALEGTEERIAAACQAAGRDRDEITLVVVTKFFPAADVATLVELGVRDIGESRDQEAKVKVGEVRDLLGDGRPMPTLHFVGQVQTKKAGSVGSYADVVHSVDRERLAQALERSAQRHDRRLEVLLQVDLDPDPDPDRGGLAPADLLEVAERLDELEHLRVRGLMTVAPLGAEPQEAFARLAELSARLRERHPEADWVSAGMSSDLEAAIAHGATHLRVGTAILGSRPSHR